MYMPRPSFTFISCKVLIKRFIPVIHMHSVWLVIRTAPRCYWANIYIAIKHPCNPFWKNFLIEMIKFIRWFKENIKPFFPISFRFYIMSIFFSIIIFNNIYIWCTSIFTYVLKIFNPSGEFFSIFFLNLDAYNIQWHITHFISSLFLIRFIT